MKSLWESILDDDAVVIKNNEKNVQEGIIINNLEHITGVTVGIPAYGGFDFNRGDLSYITYIGNTKTNKKVNIFDYFEITSDCKKISFKKVGSSDRGTKIYLREGDQIVVPFVNFNKYNLPVDIDIVGSFTENISDKIRGYKIGTIILSSETISKNCISNFENAEYVQVGNSLDYNRSQTPYKLVDSRTFDFLPKNVKSLSLHGFKFDKGLKELDLHGIKKLVIGACDLEDLEWVPKGLQELRIIYYYTKCKKLSRVKKSEREKYIKDVTGCKKVEIEY